MIALTSRLAELVATDLPPVTARPSRASSRPATSSNWTANRVKYDKSDVPPKQLLDTYAVERARAHILIRFGDAPRPSYAQLQQELGFSHRSSVGQHVDRLVDEGLLARLPGAKAPVLTKAGRTCSVYLQAHAGGEVAWRRVIRQTFGSFNRASARAVKAAALELDRGYALNREGLRRKGADGGLELDRKVTCRDIVRALRSCTTLESAARRTGIQRGAFCQRVDTLLKRAQRLVGAQ